MQVAAQKGLAEPRARFFFRQLMEGIAFCHSRYICHRDMKLENVMLDADGAWRDVLIVIVTHA